MAGTVRPWWRQAPAAPFAALALWNLWIARKWAAAFFPAWDHLAPDWRLNFPLDRFAWVTLGGNWISFGTAILFVLGLLTFMEVAGHRVGRWIAGRGIQPVELRIAAGCGLVGSLVLGAGLDGLLLIGPRPSARVLVGLLGVVGLCRWRGRLAARARVAWHEGFRTAGPVWGGLTLVAALFIAASVFSIELGWDSVTYHLRLATFAGYRHKLFHVWHHYCAPFPSQIEAVFLPGLMADTELTARVLHGCCGLLVLGALWRLAVRLGAPPVWAVWGCAACPTFLNLLTRAYIDLGLTLFATASLGAAVAWWDRRRTADAVLCGVLAGFAMGAKYTGVFLLPALACGLAPRVRGRKAWGAVVAGAVAALAPLAPWLLKNWAFTGNPVAPFLARFFGGGSEGPPEMTGFATLGSFTAGGLAEVSRRVQELFLNTGTVDGPLLPAVAGLLPLIWLVPPADPAARMLRRALGGFLLVWLVLSPDARFLLPVLPVFWALAAGAGARWLAGTGPAVRRLCRTGLALNATAGLAYGGLVLLWFYRPLTLPLGLETRDEKIAMMAAPVGTLASLRHAVERSVPPGDRMLYLSHFATYYVERECLADFHFGRALIARMIDEGETADGIGRVLRRRGIRWLVLADGAAASYLKVPGFFDVRPGGWDAFKRLLATRAEPVWQLNDWILYRLGPPHPPRPLPGLPIYETLTFRPADEQLAARQAGPALAVFLKPPPLLADVGSTFVRQGDAWSLLGRPREAVNAYRRAMQLGTHDARVHTALANAYLNLDDPGRALPLAEAAWAANPYSPETAAILAGIHATQGDGPPALACIRAARRLAPGVKAYELLEADLVRHFGNHP